MAQQKKFTTAELLNRALARQKRRNPRYSVRALARDLKLSPTYVRDLLMGKKNLPESRFQSVTKALGMDPLAMQALREAMLHETLKKKTESRVSLENILEKKNTPGKTHLSLNYTEGTLSEFSLLGPWYRMVILDWVTCDNFDPDPQVMSRRLKISAHLAERALVELAKAGFIEMRNGKWHKRHQKIHFPTTRSKPSVRNYHKTMIEKAVKVLENETSDIAFQKRLITSVSIAANPKNLEKARLRLAEALLEITDILIEGECTEVYQLNAQLFPLTGE